MLEPRGVERDRLQLRALPTEHVVELDQAGCIQGSFAGKLFGRVLAAFRAIHGLRSPAGDPGLRPARRKRLQAMTDRRQLIRDASCWALALSVGLALSTPRAKRSGVGDHRTAVGVGEVARDSGCITSSENLQSSLARLLRGLFSEEAMILWLNNIDATFVQG